MRIYQLLESSKIRDISPDDRDLAALSKIVHNRSLVNPLKIPRTYIGKRWVKPTPQFHNSITVVQGRQGWAIVYPLRDLPLTLDISMAIDGNITTQPFFRGSKEDFDNAKIDWQKTADQLGGVEQIYVLPYDYPGISQQSKWQRLTKQLGHMPQEVYDTARADPDLVSRIQPLWNEIIFQVQRQARFELRRQGNFDRNVFDHNLEQFSVHYHYLKNRRSCNYIIDRQYTKWNKPYSDWSLKDFKKFIVEITDRLVLILKGWYTNEIKRKGI